jgi:DNA-binding MarR family transcriptional regulator
MSMDELYAKPGHLIRRSQQIAVAIFMEETAAFDVTPVQYAALFAIRKNPDIDATRLSDLIAFDRSTLGDVLERLEKKGLVQRKPGRDDKRTKLLSITPAGAALLDRMEEAAERAQERILAPLGKAQQQQFMEMLTRLVHVNNVYSRVPLRPIKAAGGEPSS